MGNRGLPRLVRPRGGVETSTHAETRATEYETGLPRGARFQGKEETRLVAACPGCPVRFQGSLDAARRSARATGYWWTGRITELLATPDCETTSCISPFAVFAGTWKLIW